MILKGSVLNHKIKGTKNQSVWYFHCQPQTKCSNAAKAIKNFPKQPNVTYICSFQRLLQHCYNLLLKGHLINTLWPAGVH